MGGFFGGGGGGGDGGAAQQAAEEARKKGLREQVNSLFGIGDPAAAAALKAEEDRLGESVRGYYTPLNARAYGDAARALKFGAADTGNTNSSAFADAQARLNENNALAGTRIADAVQQAINRLRSDRDTSRMNAIQLIDTGSGPEAVSAAQQGLNQALNTASASNKQDLFSDLFANAAFASGVGANNARQQQLAALYANKSGVGGTYKPTYGTPVKA